MESFYRLDKVRQLLRGRPGIGVQVCLATDPVSLTLCSLLCQEERALAFLHVWRDRLVEAIVSFLRMDLGDSSG